MRYKTPVCSECGRVLKGRVHPDVKVVCYFCANPRRDEDEEPLNVKDVK